MIETTSITVGIQVGNLKEGVEWYRRLLMASPDLEPVGGVLEYEIRNGFWLQISEGNQNSGGSVVRFGVKDLDAARESLLDRGIKVDEIVRIESLIAFFDFQDPWENQLSFYELLSSVG